MPGGNKSIETPYLPIEKFDPSQIHSITQNESDVDKDSGFTNLNVILDELPSNSSDLGRDVFSKEVATLLYGMGMEKYFDLFKAEDISLETFLQLNYNDLNQLGITNPKDQDTIIKNLKEVKTEDLELIGPTKQYVVPSNSYEDFVIAKNVLNQIILLQSYGSYTVLQMKKNELYDYFVSRDQTAVGILKLLAGQALIQSNRISDILYDGGMKGNNMITLAVKLSQKELPEQLQKKLVYRPNKKGINKKKIVLITFGIIGTCSVCVLIAKQIVNR